jgi:hypothetical protein
MFRELASLRVTKEHRGAKLELALDAARHCERSLHLAGALERGEAKPGRQRRYGEAISARRARGDVATPLACHDAGGGPTYDLEREVGRRSKP